MPQANSSPFALNISTPENTMKSDQEIRVRIKLTNTSGHEIALTRPKSPGQAEFNYSIRALSQTGGSPPETEYYRQLQGKANDSKHVYAIAGSDSIVQLKSGESFEDDAIITKLFNFNRSGKYLITVSRKVPDALGKGEITSNTLAVTITN
jgi:hypothetical protein